MNVLSLFDGISCGQIALERVGIKVDNYFASEIDKYTIKVTQNNYPNTIQLGDIKTINLDELSKIDMIIGGSPCQSLSIACHQKESGLIEGKSVLFWDYVRVLEKIKPKYFLLENVVSMKNTDRDAITETLKYKPIMINSNLVSAQNRKRLYWTNIPNIKQPKDKCIYVKDILEKNVSEIYFRDWDFVKVKKKYNIEKPMKIGHWNSGGQGQCVYDINGKNICLVSNLSCMKAGAYIIDDRLRGLTELECERLQTLPDNYTKCIGKTQRYKSIGNGWTVDIISHIFKNIVDI